MIDDLKTEISDKLPPVEVEDVNGRGTVVQEFMVTVDKGKVPVAGCKINSGQSREKEWKRCLYVLK